METWRAPRYRPPMSATERNFGSMLREWRQRRRISQLDLALDGNISTRHISFLETGRSQPSRDMVLHLAEHLAVPLRDRNVLLAAAERDWPAWTWLCIAASAALLGRFILHQRQRAALGLAPRIDPALFEVRRFRVGLLAVLALFGGVASFFFVLALYLQRGRGMAPLPSGLVFTAMALPFTAASLSAGRIGGLLGRPPLVMGALGMAIGLAALRGVVAWEGVGGPILPLLGALVIDGAGMGLVLAPLVTTVLAGLPANSAGAAAGVLATAQQLANALGVAVIGVAFFGTLGGGYAGAFDASLDWLVVLALGLAGLVWWLGRQA
jgi:transcriptional regulator with XRE-family HTH domain